VICNIGGTVAFTLIDLPPGSCHWPVGENEDGEHLFCGEPIAAKSYCRHCYALAYLPPVKQAKKPRSNNYTPGELPRLGVRVRVFV
jgi:hypothetical protein